MLRKTVLLLMLVTFTISLAAPISLAASPIPMTEPRWDHDWTRRAEITVDNTVNGAVLTDFAVYLAVAYDSDMNSDFADLRFVDEDHTTVLAHWTNNVVSSTSAECWIEVPNIPASSAKTIYVYYGNASASSTSDIHGPFLFGDDFEDGGWTAANWTVGNGTWNVTGGHLHGERFTAPVDGYVVTPDLGVTDYAVDAMISHPGSVGSCVAVLGRGSAGSNTYYELEIDENDMTIYRFDGPSPSYANLGSYWEGAAPVADHWYTIAMTFKGSTIYGERLSDGNFSFDTTDSNYSTGVTGLMVHNQAGDFDDFRVRKVSTNWISSTVGNEEYDDANIEETTWGQIKAM